MRKDRKESKMDITDITNLAAEEGIGEEDISIPDAKISFQRETEIIAMVCEVLANAGDEFIKENGTLDDTKEYSFAKFIRNKVFDRFKKSKGELATAFLWLARLEREIKEDPQKAAYIVMGGVNVLNRTPRA